MNTEELNFLKIKNRFFLRMRNRGFSKHKLSLWFSEIKYSSRAKYLGANPGNICYFQRTRETQAETLLINMAEGIMKEVTSGVPDDPTEVVSEDEGEHLSTCTHGVSEFIDCIVVNVEFPRYNPLVFLTAEMNLMLC